MKFMIGEMTLGDILDRSLKLMLSRFGTFYGLTAIVFLPSYIFQVVIQLITAAPNSTPSQTQMIALVTTSSVLFFSMIVLTPLGVASMLHIIAQEFVGRHVSLGQGLKFGFRRLGSVLSVSITVGIVVFVGYLLCLIPGILFYIWYIFSVQVVVVEHLKGGKAMARSKALTEGYRRNLFNLIFLLGIIGFLVGMVGGGLGVFLPMQKIVATADGTKVVPNYANMVIDLGVIYAVNSLVYCFTNICMTLYYFNLRIKKEGFDLEIAARQQRGEEGEGSAPLSDADFDANPPGAYET